MKIVFAGTPEFAAQAMRAIYDAGHHIVLALTQPDRPAGRGMHLQASPVKQFAIEKIYRSFSLKHCGAPVQTCIKKRKQRLPINI